MSKKVLNVVGSTRRCCYQNACGSFNSAHKQEDIEKWLEHKGVGEFISNFMDVFADEWFFEKPEVICEGFDVGFEEEDISEFEECFYDKEIQEFLDEEPKREIRSLYHQFTEFMGNVQGMKDTASQLLEDCKKVVETGNVPLHLSKDELKMFDTLEGLIKS